MKIEAVMIGIASAIVMTIAAIWLVALIITIVQRLAVMTKLKAAIYQLKKWWLKNVYCRYRCGKWSKQCGHDRASSYGWCNMGDCPRLSK